MEEDQQYFGDIVLAIKQVMSNHLQELQEKFHNRFEKLEDEIKRRDEIINRLKTHIFELERAAEESLTDSVETIISNRGRSQSWEDRNRRESQELKDLPRQTLQPQAIWTNRRSEEIVLEIDSNSDTEEDTEEIGENSEQGEDSGEYENSSSNWEIELLAAQIRERRSASLDPNSARPIRKRFTRGGSAEHKRD